MTRAQEKYKLRIKRERVFHNNLSRRNIARAIKRKYAGTDRYFKINEHLMNLVISRIMELKVEQMFTTGYTELGHDLGYIGMVEIEIKSDNFNKLPIDWDRTLDLWLDNPKAKEKKRLVRKLNVNTGVRFMWGRKGNIPNISYFSFKPIRSLRQRISYYRKYNKPIMFLTK